MLSMGEIMEKTSKKRHCNPDNRLFQSAAVIGLLGGALFLAAYIGISKTPFFGLSSKARVFTRNSSNSPDDRLQLDSILHYATSRVVPQQTLNEIRVSFDVLKAQSPCNFLVFGLGHDSLMWASLNPGGTTLFLEESSDWVDKVFKVAPYLQAHTVNYRTKLSDSDDLLKLYETEPDCFAENSFLRGNEKCKLALNVLPEEVYSKEWDLIMIDAPTAYFPEAPGRMAAIYSAAVMARNRKGSGATHVFLHDVNRKVERVYAETFLCRKNLVKSVGRLGHFKIPPSTDSKKHFC
ncbi:hypothetical protein ACH5RR_030845 [Cinchona calisaya]|uniref:Polysaccharide biosynthesis domain-containing protein n=1 Tax=Cinchona calisaya TaxID=153742 RepID=A0ABD2YX27_9GENT